MAIYEIQVSDALHSFRGVTSWMVEARDKA